MSQKVELDPSLYDPIQLLKITRNGVAKQPTKIKAAKAAHPEKIKLLARFLKEMTEPLSGMLSFIYQCPVSLTAIPCKTLEHQILTESLQGFRAN